MTTAEIKARMAAAVRDHESLNLWLDTAWPDQEELIARNELFEEFSSPALRSIISNRTPARVQANRAAMRERAREVG